VGTNYPGSPDVFNVPSEPESTPLSEAGSATRNHTESIRDQGLAIMAIEANASKKAHDHSGDATDVAKGPKLAQANTHQSVDTDAAPGSIHHTLDTTTGVDANKAAPANHVHDYNTPGRLLNRPYVICLSTTRPSSPFPGLLIFETNTHRFRFWDQFPGEGSASWKLLPLSFVPTCRLQQTITQQIAQTGTVIQFDTELEDNNSFFNLANSHTDIVINEPGLYHLDAAVAWNSSNIPDTAYVWFTVNGIDTIVRNQSLMRGGTGITPGFSQILPVSGKLRLVANDIVRLKAGYLSPGGIIGFILSFFDGPTKVASRIEIAYLGS
jgi:hypothetical protein